MILKILATLLLFICNINAIDLFNLPEDKNILEESSIYFDEFNVEDIESIEEQVFTPYSQRSVGIEFSRRSIWIKLKIYNSSIYNKRRCLYFDNFSLDYISFYTKVGNEYIESNDGIFREREFNNIINPYFAINLEANSEKTFFIKVNSNTSVLNFKLFLLTQKDMYKKESFKQVILSLFFGSILALIIYNLFIFFFTKELSYLFYGLYLSCFTIAHSYFTGMYLFIINTSFEYIFMKIFILMTIFLLIFIKTILNLKKYRYLNYGIHGFVSILILLFALLSKDFYPIALVMGIMLASKFYVLFISFYLLNKSKEVKYVIVGWCFAIFGFLILALYINGIFNYKEYFPYLFEVCIFLEATLFSMALANKLNRTSELKEAFDRNKTLTKELHHRVKNNMQFIISIYRLKLSKDLSKESLIKLKEVENTIFAISKTHELLYSRNKFEYISTKNYFEELLGEIKKGYNTENIDITLDISVDLSLEEAINCGIILNEAITNTLKHAFKNHKGFIHIKIIKILNKKVFIIEDNGIGFSQDLKSFSFGLTLINSLVLDELKGNIVIESNRGTRLIIEF